jgi:hypothetical protein
MRYEIDAVYLDRAGCVLRVDQALVRGKVWPMQRGASVVLELPAGYARKAFDPSGRYIGGCAMIEMDDTREKRRTSKRFAPERMRTRGFVASSPGTIPTKYAPM